LLVWVALVAWIGCPSAAYAAGHVKNPDAPKAIAIAERTEAVKELRARGHVVPVLNKANAAWDLSAMSLK